MVLYIMQTNYEILTDFERMVLENIKWWGQWAYIYILRIVIQQ